MSDKQNALICIPDISGFTEFMSNIGIETSSDVISSLLNKVIYSNQIGLKVSEIEGDAILFYKYTPLPSLKELIEQCKLFYKSFYDELEELKKTYKDNDGSEEYISDTLGLKIILHYGKQISSVQIGKNVKLMGEDIIIAHRLLKNSIEIEEYILLSEDLLSEYKKTAIDSNFEWNELYNIKTFYEHIGKVEYSYIDLTPLIP